MQSPIATVGVLLRRGANPAALDALRQVCSEEGVQATIVNIKQTLSPNLDAIVRKHFCYRATRGAQKTS